MFCNLNYMHVGDSKLESMANTIHLLIYASRTMMISFIMIICSISTTSMSTAAAINYSKAKGLNVMCPQDKQWFCFNSTTRAYSCVIDSKITCSDDGPIMKIDYCATYDEKTRVLSISKCSNQAEIGDYNRSSWGTRIISLPTVLTELNDYMCGPLNRKDLVCSECADGFGPSATSFGYCYKCVNCTNAGVVLFLFVRLFPITLLYLLILVFQIRITSAPMPCFIIYAQSIASLYDFEVPWVPLLESFTVKQNGNIYVSAQIINTLYGVFRLEFFHFILPPFCISNGLNPSMLHSLAISRLFIPSY